MQTITLTGNQKVLTLDESIAYRVTKGSVLVFLQPECSSHPMRRMFVGKANINAIIPSLSQRLDIADSLCTWHLLLLPEETATLEQLPNEGLYIDAFLSEMKIYCNDKTTSVLTQDAMCLLLQSRYQSNHDRNLEQIRERMHHRRRASDGAVMTISSVFRKKEERYTQKAHTGAPLYDAMAVLCDYHNINIISYEAITRNVVGEPDVSDIARLSGFVCREVNLCRGWLCKDSDALLLLREETKNPIVCFPKRRGLARIWDPVTKTFDEFTEAQTCSPHNRAFVISRPLKGDVINLKEITKFVFKEMGVRDIPSILIGTLLATFVSLQFARLSETLYDIIIPQGSYNTLFGYGFLMIAYMLGGLCFEISKNVAGFRLNSRIKYALQTAIFDRLFHLPESYFRGHENADLAYRAGMLAAIYVSLFNSMSQIIIMTAFSSIYLLKMFKYSNILSGIGIGFIIFNILLSIIIGYLFQRLQQRRARLIGGLRSFLFQSFCGIHTLRSTGTEDEALHEYIKKYSEMGTLDLKISYNRQLYTALTALTGAFSVIALYYTVACGDVLISIGQFMGFMAANTAFSASMTQVANNALLIFSMLPLMKNSMELFRVKPERGDLGIITTDMKGDIRIDAISFAYGKSEEMLLKDISLHIHPGEYVAIVGATGCGKSTLLRLLLGFEKPNKGKIYYDGIDLDRMNKPELRRKMGVVLQDGMLFAGSIYRNIRIARPNASQEEVMTAVTAVGLDDELTYMPLGLQTLLTDQSQTISGGQKQRILLARAILGKPKILILDEATSSLDNISQDKVCESLANLNATRIVVAHRLSTVIKCDRIAVMHNGQIAEIGTFEQLMEKKSIFYELARKQAL